jgi:hypothetical protein
VPNQYTRMTRASIMRKIHRQRNPVQSVLQLAREFGVDTSYQRHSDWYGREGKIDHRAPKTFVNKVKSLIGEREYNRLRQSNAVNHLYR